jgi:AraC-like DNA-binding protein
MDARSDFVDRAWTLARAGDFKAAIEAARAGLDRTPPHRESSDDVELHLVCASCAMRQGLPAQALQALDAAERAAAQPDSDAGLLPRVMAWRAEFAYFQGRYSDANELVLRLTPSFERAGDLAYAAFALRIRIAILLARGEYDAVAGIADRAVAIAEASGDAYVLVQIENVLGAVHFDRATSKLGEPHARAHLSSLEPRDLVPMEADAREALRHFERARAIAESAGYEFAAWYVAGNIERLEILLGRPQRAVAMIRKRLEALQSRGARYDEIVTRSNLAWALRLLGHHAEALHELDVALTLARATGTSNVMLEYLEYDRSIVLDALGDAPGARAAYRRYTQLVAAYNRAAPAPAVHARPVVPRRPLEPWFLKRADRFLQERLAAPFAVAELARHCGVSQRTLEKAFIAYRGMTPVAYARNARLDLAHQRIHVGEASVAEIAHACGFRSATTFALEYRKRFGVPPSRTKRLAG